MNLPGAGGWSIALFGAKRQRRGQPSLWSASRRLQHAPVKPPADASLARTKVLLLKRASIGTSSR
jgi:hypothetical protein